MSKYMTDKEFNDWMENDQGDPEGDKAFAKFKEEVKHLPAGKRERTLVWKIIHWELSHWNNFFFKGSLTNLVGLYLYTWDKVFTDSLLCNIPIKLMYGIPIQDANNISRRVIGKNKSKNGDFALIRALIAYRLKRLLGFR